MAKWLKRKKFWPRPEAALEAGLWHFVAKTLIFSYIELKKI